MKTFTRVIAVLMMVAVLASLMTACGEPKNHIDSNLVGTWKQTDDVDGNWTWTFNNDGTCKLVGDSTGFSDEGTFFIEDEDNGKIKLKLNSWEKEVTYTYTVTEKVMILSSFDVSYYCDKVQ